MYLYINLKKNTDRQCSSMQNLNLQNMLKKIIKVLKAFVDITVNFPIHGLHCTYINTSVGFITEHKSSLCKVGDQLTEVHKCMHNIIYW